MFFHHLLDKLTERPRPHVRKRGCLQQRHRLKECSRCITTCPNQAIALEQPIQIDETKCDGCGLCAAVCPSHSFALASLPYYAACERLPREDDRLIVSCVETEPRCGLRLPCLLGIHWEYLTALLLLFPDVEFVFDLSSCGACDKAGLQSLFTAAVDKAESAVKQLQVAPKLTIVTDTAVEEKLSRTAFFGLLGQTSRKLGQDVSAGILPEGQRSVRNFNREFFWQAVEQNHPVYPYSPQSSNPFTLWQVSDRCDACGLCSGLCPWGCWEFLQQDQSTVMRQHFRRCTGCGLCAEFCPHQALSPVDESVSINLSEKALTCRVLPLVECQRCRLLFTPADGETMCMTCQKKVALF